MLNDLIALAFASDGNLFVTRRGTGLSGSGSIVKFTPAGAMSTFIPSGLFLPKDLAFDGFGNLYEADSGSGSVFRFAPNMVSTRSNRFMYTVTPYCVLRTWYLMGEPGPITQNHPAIETSTEGR